MLVRDSVLRKKKRTVTDYIEAIVFVLRNSVREERYAHARFDLRSCRGELYPPSEGSLSVLSHPQAGFSDPSIAQTELSLLPDWHLARQWMRTCEKAHANCRRLPVGESPGSQPPLPARVIDIGEVGGREPRLLESRGQKADYATLSHCWGKLQPLTTTTSNITTHLLSIPLSSFPPLFQDAITATRTLGLQYIWIDSLCIIQDSPADWERECTNMAQVYQLSAITICAPQADDSSHCFLQPRTYNGMTPRIWEYTSDGEGPCRATMTFAPREHYWGKSQHYPDGPSLSRQEYNSALQTRGWIFQEYVLSPRVLFFGEFRMYWECRTYLQFEDCDGVEERKVSERARADFHSIFRKHDFPPPQQGPLTLSNVKDRHKTWLKAVEEFTRRRLTMPKDKLPALGGIAESLLCGRGIDYLAGTFRDDIHSGLTWYVWDSEGAAPPAPPVYRAPSWSWASHDSLVKFKCLEQPRVKGVGGNWPSKIHQASPLAKMQIHDITIRHRGENPFGELTSGSIKLSGLVNEGVVIAAHPGNGEIEFVI